MSGRDGHPWDEGFARACDVLTGAAVFGFLLSSLTFDYHFALAFVFAMVALQVVRP